MFKFFTERANRPSLRLRSLARGFELWGMLSTMFVAAGFWLVYVAPRVGILHRVIETLTGEWLSRETTTQHALSIFTIWTLQAASFFIIGRALRKRQRWGTYLAGVTMGAPLVQQLISPYRPLMSVAEIAGTTVALCVMVTVWDELNTVRDDDFADQTTPTTHDNAAMMSAYVERTVFDSSQSSAAIEATVRALSPESHNPPFIDAVRSPVTAKRTF